MFLLKIDSIWDKSSILTQFSYLKVDLASMCEHLKEYFFFMIYLGKGQEKM